MAGRVGRLIMIRLLWGMWCTLLRLYVLREAGGMVSVITPDVGVRYW